MPSVFIPFDGWSPGASYFGEGWATVSNVYSPYGEWRPWRLFLNSSASVADGPINGAYVHQWMSGAGGSYVPNTQTIFGGSPTKLYSVDPATGAFTNISRAAAYTAFPAGWRFASVGNDIWAVNWLDAMQRRTNNAGNFADGPVGSFQPRPRFIATVRQHLVWANDSTGRQDDWGWSDADDATNYTPPTGTSTSIAGRPAPLISLPGQITGLVSAAQYGLAFKWSGIYYLEYTGTTQVFRPDVLSPDVGSPYPSSIIRTRHGIFFLGSDGFYRIQGLSAPQKVSSPGIDQFLLDSVFTNNSYGFTTWLEDIQMVAFQVSQWPLIGWAFRTSWLNQSNNKALLYNPVTGHWSVVDLVLVSTIISRPYASTPYDSLAAFKWDGAVSRYAPLANTAGTGGVNIVAPLFVLRFRPANTERALRMAQSELKAVVPIFSKTSVSGTALTPSVTVEPILDPFNDVYGAPEGRVATERSPIDGSYPIQRSGLYFRVTIACSAEDFANFEGAWVDQELLT